MENTKEQIYFKSLMQPFINLGCTIEFNPTRVISKDGIEIYNENNNEL